MYEWDQTLDEVNIYIQPPPGAGARDIECTITNDHVSVGLKGNPPYLSEDTPAIVMADESYWMMNDGELHLLLAKTHKGQLWDSALKGHMGSQLDMVSVEEEKKRLMRERFQEEHPQFDFRFLLSPILISKHGSMYLIATQSLTGRCQTLKASWAESNKAENGGNRKENKN